MTWLLVGVIVLLFLGSIGLVNQRDAARGAERAAERRAAEQEDAHARTRLAVEEAMVPIVWAWGHLQEAGGDAGLQNRLRFYVGTAMTSIQEALGADDEELGELVAAAPEPPRRLPRYPRFPRVFATPEDLAQVPAQPVAPFEPGDRFPRDF